MIFCAFYRSALKNCIKDQRKLITEIADIFGSNVVNGLNPVVSVVCIV